MAWANAIAAHAIHLKVMHQGLIQVKNQGVRVLASSKLASSHIGPSPFYSLHKQKHVAGNRDTTLDLLLLTVAGASTKG